uniref:NADH dehydrogenase subunit 2 n=1 Tax=Aoria nigripes TaxID=2954116 RepID=UPI0021150DA1|nr:NADH dehydrogenase subunit 2 [Aoria nigripes]USM11433.1 NADH dehydrogenase subunit 2 [Aoria nigripes]
MFKFYKLMFFLSMMTGTLITISSYSWMTMWIGLEINLLSIIPLMKNNNNKFSTEAAFKYFITQSMASTLFLFTMILNINLIEQIGSFSMEILTTIFYISIFIKMGASPFHAWFPEVLEGLSWMNCLLMLTWQKIAPMIILMQNFKLSLFTTLIIVSSAFVGSIMGLNQISLRKIISYSSINHIAWMLSSMSSQKMIWMIYFCIYSLVSITIIIMLKISKTLFLHQMIILKSNKLTNIIWSLNFLSLGGLPPFIGFFPKWMTINFLVWNENILLSLMLILMTMISLFVYSRMMFSSLLLSSQEMLYFPKFQIKFKFIFMNFLTLNMLLICPLILNSI